MEEPEVKEKEEKEILVHQKRKEPRGIIRIRGCREANISGFGAQGIDHHNPMEAHFCRI